MKCRCNKIAITLNMRLDIAKIKQILTPLSQVYGERVLQKKLSGPLATKSRLIKLDFRG